MDEIKGKVTCADIAALFMEKAAKESIVSELFDFFGFDCLARISLDHAKLDEYISAFEASEYKDAEQLERIIEIIRCGKKTDAGNERTLLAGIKRYIGENLAAELSLEQIAAEMNISYHYLCHFFKARTGMSVGHYRTAKRLEAAIRELMKEDAKITDIALSCGFSNVGYFSETFSKFTGLSPTAFKAKHAGIPIHGFYDFWDIMLSDKLEHMYFCSPQMEDIDIKVSEYTVHLPDAQYAFLHEAAVAEFDGVLYASWYNCIERELKGYTPINGKRSLDGGRTWSELEKIADDPSGELLYCPPVYCEHNGKLYMFMNTMVKPDHIHSLELYRLNGENGRFEHLWSRPIPFKLNTNVIALPNGKLLFPGRVAELDSFPNTPAVMICDSGDPEGEWRVVRVAENGDLPDGARLVHPETTVICLDSVLYMFNRNDRRRVPLVYISRDMGESWSEMMGNDLPYINSKIYCGTLSDGRNYLIANIDKTNRSRLAVYFTEKGSIQFTKRALLYDRERDNTDGSVACHYPAATESGGKLYIIATRQYEDNRRGAVMYVTDIDSIS